MATDETDTKEYRAIMQNNDMLIDTLGKTVDPASFARKLKEKSLVNDRECVCLFLYV